MTFSEILQILQIISIFAAIIVAGNQIKDRGDDKTVALTEMRVDLRYIKEKVEGLDSLRTDVTKAMQSAKSAHNRLDEHLRYEHQKDVHKTD